MVYYEFGLGTPGWKKDKMTALAKALGRELDIPIQDSNVSMLGMRVEVKQEKEIVRIRHLTNLSEKQRRALVIKAINIYSKIMGFNLRKVCTEDLNYEVTKDAK